MRSALHSTKKFEQRDSKTFHSRVWGIFCRREFHCCSSTMATTARSSSSHPRTCPCKTLPWTISSATAAEYGDVATLERRGTSSKSSTSSTSTPLHLAAQHGHVHATLFLLQTVNVNDQSGGATPLHRASFAGALGTMKILLDKGASLEARDASFGDQQTPLHKAASGGRYLAVQLLLESGADTHLMDAAGRTPLQVTQEKQRDSTVEAASVRRWDAIAGGSADWDKCVILLEGADVVAKSVPVKPLNDCWDCTDGNCRTASWESAFRSALSLSVDQRLHDNTPERYNEAPSQTTARIPDTDTSYEPPTSTSNTTTSSLGRPCDSCHTLSIALYPRNQLLVCLSCRDSCKP